MRRRVLLVQPSLQPPGGGNGVAAWMLQALVASHDVTVLSWVPVAVAPINRFFGTHLDRADFVNHVVPWSWRQLVDPFPVPGALLRSSLLMRYTRRVSDGFDVILGAHNEIDYGRRGIQYVHYPSYFRPRPRVDLRWYHLAPLLKAYYGTADAIAAFSRERMVANVTLANSAWTAARLRESLGVDARVVYPPVVGSASPMSWSDRRRGFIAMGRLSPEKEYERTIAILARVKRHHPDIALTIVGTWDRGTAWYLRRVQQAIAAHAAEGWVSLRRDLSRDDVRALLAGHRYGIHGMREEHFGMAPAEMVRAGMIVWVPDGGGQVEIVGDEPLLRYGTEDEAADAISAVLHDPISEQRLREHLRTRGDLFSETRFMASIQQEVGRFS